MLRTSNEIIRTVTRDYLSTLVNPPYPTPTEIEQYLLEEELKVFELENVSRPKGSKLKAPHKLIPAQIADIVAALYPVACIMCAGSNADADYDLLALYGTQGPNKGIYVTDEQVFHKIAREYNYSLSSREIQDFIGILKDVAPRKVRCTNRDLIAVNNGIFDYSSKVLMPFNPDFVFIAKSKVDYVANATNPVIHNDDDGTDWDVESWISELSDDAEVVNLLWEVMGAIIRPHVPWNKSAWFYSNTGNNGKGTLCELMRSLCGEGSYASIPLSDFGKDFMLEPLTRASAIIVDENDVGGYIDKAANLKAVITNDVIAVNRKFKSPIAYQFYGFMVQCLNEFPRIRDKSDSFYRRQLFIPFEKCFTGVERKYIKNDYLHRKDVLEYVLHRVLHMNYYELSEPDSCKQALGIYKEFNDPVRQFMEDIEPQLVWDLVPFSFLYDLYKAWFKKNSPSGTIQGKVTFVTDLLNLLPQYPKWICRGRQVALRPSKTSMSKPEYLIAEYDLRDWMNKSYRGNDLDKICVPVLKATYNGILRISSSTDDEEGGNNEDDK